MASSEEALRREFEQAAAYLAQFEPGEVDAMIGGVEVPGHPPDGPRNRSERRRLERERRRMKGRTRPALKVPEQVPAAPASEKKEGEKKRELPTTNDIPHFYLREWAITRGPLFEDPRAVVCRAVALGLVTGFARGVCRDPSVGVRAARYLGEHHPPLPPSKKPASGEAFARASALLADLQRAAREGRADPIDAVYRVLQAFDPGLDKADQLALLSWAHLLAAVMGPGEETLKLRAARTLLSWTKSEAFQVGYGAPDRLTEEDREFIAAYREMLCATGGTADEGGPPRATGDHASPAGAAPT